MDTHDNLTPAQQRDIGSVWRDTPTYEPSGTFKDDKPTNTLDEAMKSEFPRPPTCPMDVYQYKETGKRGDEALDQLSWACRSFLELPRPMRELITRLPRITQQMENSLAEYQRFASTNGWDTSKVPSELLASALGDPRISIVPQISTFVKGFDSFERDLLNAVIGSKQDNRSLGPTRLEHTLSALRETRDLDSEFMMDVCGLSAQNEALKSFESLKTDPGVLDTLRSANEYLSQLNGPIINRWSQFDDGSFHYRWEEGVHWPYDVNIDLDQGKLHRAVNSLASTSDGRKLAGPIMQRALEFGKRENDPSEPKPSQVINMLHHFLKETTSPDPYVQTMEVFTRFCEMIKAKPTTQAVADTLVVAEKVDEGDIGAETPGATDSHAPSALKDVNPNPASDLAVDPSGALSLDNLEEVAREGKNATDSHRSWDSLSLVESEFSDLLEDCA